MNWRRAALASLMTTARRLALTEGSGLRRLRRRRRSLVVAANLEEGLRAVASGQREMAVLEERELQRDIEHLEAPRHHLAEQQRDGVDRDLGLRREQHRRAVGAVDREPVDGQ